MLRRTSPSFMRLPTAIVSLLAAAISNGAEPIQFAPGGPAANPTPREAALDQLLTERASVPQFDAAIAEAKKQGISEQAILEARFLFHVDRSEEEALVALLPEFQKRSENFNVEESEIFAATEDWLAVIEYIKSISALRAGDKDGFKKHITEAFWLSPKQAAAFAPHVENFRMQEAMANTKVDFSTSLAPLAGGEAVALSKILEGKKALLIYFWSPWSGECEAMLPDIATLARELPTKDIALAAVIMDNSEKVLADARTMLGAIEPKATGHWLADLDHAPFSRSLRVQSLPIMALVSTEGKVLFNGHPTSDDLWNALKKINPSITKPDLKTGLE